MTKQTSKEKFEAQLQAMHMLHAKVRMSPMDNASRQKLKEQDAVLESLFNDAYPSIESYIEECFRPINALAEEWGLERREPVEMEFYKSYDHSLFGTIRNIQQDASENSMVVREKIKYTSLKIRHDPKNLVPANAESVVSRMRDAFHKKTPDGSYNFTGRIVDMKYDSVSIGGYGTGRHAHFIRVQAVDANGIPKSFVLSKDDLEHRGLDKSPQAATKLELGDMISVGIRPSEGHDLYRYIPEMSDLPFIESLFIVVPSAFYKAGQENDVVIEGRVEEYGKLVLHGDWPTRQVTLSDAAGNKGTFILPGNADYDLPTAKEGEQVVGVSSHGGRLSVLRPLG